jgi:hypothetical protein
MDAIAPAIGMRMRGEHAFVLVGVHADGHAQLLQVVDALDAFAGFLGPGQCRQQHAGEQGNDGNDHQQFNQGEAELSPALPRPHHGP